MSSLGLRKDTLAKGEEHITTRHQHTSVVSHSHCPEGIIPHPAPSTEDISSLLMLFKYMVLQQSPN